MTHIAQRAALTTWIESARLRPGTETIIAFLREHPECFAVTGDGTDRARPAEAWDAACGRLDLYASQPDMLPLALDRHLGRELSDRVSRYFTDRTRRATTEDADVPEDRRRAAGMLR